MKIEQFAKSLVASFSKDTVVSDAQRVSGEIKSVLQPAYKQAAELMKSWKFQSEEIEAYTKLFAREAKSTRGNMIVSIEQSIPQVLKNLETVEELINAGLDEETAAGGLTYFKAQLLQFLEAASFYSAYGRAFLNFVYVHESAKYITEENSEVDSIEAHLVPAEITYIEANFRTFIAVYNAVTHSGDLKKVFGSIPDIVVTDENAKTLPHTVGATKIDPLAFGLIAPWLNPIYHVRMKIAEWQVERYQLAQQELRQLQMRNLALEQLKKGQPNAKLQQEIEYNERRIQGLKAKLVKMERDYA